MSGLLKTSVITGRGREEGAAGRIGRGAGEIFSLYKKFDPQNGSGVYSLYRSMTHKLDHPVRDVKK